MTLRSRSQTLKCYVKVFRVRFFSTFPLWKQLRQTGGWTSVTLVTLTCGSWSKGQHDPYLTVQWFLPYILTVWCMKIILWDYESVWPGVWPQNKYRSLWPVFHGPVILLYIVKTVWCMNILLRNYESVWPDVWLKNKCRSLWPILHVPVILPYILKTICVWTSYFWIMSQYDTTFDLKINLGHCDLYFMVQWFYLISWRLFDIWTPYFGIMSQYDPMFGFKIFVPHCDIYFMVQWFCPIFWKLFSGWISYFGIMSQNETTCDLQIFIGHCDLYFMVYWICPLSWRLFDVWTSYFRIMSQYDMTFDLEINVDHCDLYFMVQWIFLTSYIVFDERMSYFWKMSQCNTTFDLKINLGHSDLYFMVQWFAYISWSSDFYSYIFALKNILVVLAKPDSGELRCPATALIYFRTFPLHHWFIQPYWWQQPCISCVLLIMSCTVPDTRGCIGGTCPPKLPPVIPCPLEISKTNQLHAENRCMNSKFLNVS